MLLNVIGILLCTQGVTSRHLGGGDGAGGGGGERATLSVSQVDIVCERFPSDWFDADAMRHFRQTCLRIPTRLSSTKMQSLFNIKAVSEKSHERGENSAPEVADLPQVGGGDLAQVPSDDPSSDAAADVLEGDRATERVIHRVVLRTGGENETDDVPPPLRAACRALVDKMVKECDSVKFLFNPRHGMIHLEREKKGIAFEDIEIASIHRLHENITRKEDLARADAGSVNDSVPGRNETEDNNAGDAGLEGRADVGFVNDSVPGRNESGKEDINAGEPDLAKADAGSDNDSVPERNESGKEDISVEDVLFGKDASVETEQALLQAWGLLAFTNPITSIVWAITCFAGGFCG